MVRKGRGGTVAAFEIPQAYISQSIITFGSHCLAPSTLIVLFDELCSFFSLSVRYEQAELVAYSKLPQHSFDHGRHAG